MNKTKSLLESAIRECEKHLKRLTSAYNKINPLIPIDGEKYNKLTDTEIEHFDQYLYRFSKLQDAIGKKLIRSTLLFLGESIEGKSFIDMFDRLEQIGVIENFDKWQELREKRNALAHEYEDEPDENAEKLNQIYMLKPRLEDYFLNIKFYIEKHTSKLKNE